MQFLRFLEKLRNPFFDFLFSLVTRIGEETVFLVIAIFIFWCINKREGYYVLICGLVGTLVNQTLKLACRIPRPWDKNPSFTIVESARPAATGYSFPSGHTQNVAGTFGCIANWTKRRFLQIMSVAVIVLVAFSRMYLGVHTPADVCFSLGFAAILVILLHPIFASEEKFRRAMPYVAAASVLLAVGYLIFAFIAPRERFDADNLESARQNAATLFGCTLGLIPVYILDAKFIKFETGAKWYSQIIKLVVGFVVLLLIKEGVKLIFGDSYYVRCIRYFLVVVFAGCVWPMTFPFFSRLRIGALDRVFSKSRKNK